MFADIVNFNDVCTQCKPMELVQLLNDLYSNFDRLTMLNGVFKVKNNFSNKGLRNFMHVKN